MSARKTMKPLSAKANEDKAGPAIGADHLEAARLSTCLFDEENRAGVINAAGRSPGTKDDHGVRATSPGAQESSMRETASICAPEDCEHGAAAAARLFGRPSDEIRRYAAANDATAFYVCRWFQPDGQIDVRTLSWRPGFGWIFRAWAGGRPLYRLEEIITDEQAQIMVCASERAADAAAKLFPDCAVTCSSGATLEVAKSDWTPLAGRNIVIWPNNDDVSRAFANEVAATLAAMNCVVSIIDATALAAIKPGGGVREPQEKWGAADAILDWADTKTLRKAARDLATPFKRPLAYASYGRFNMTAAGLYASIEKKSGENRDTEKVWVCDPFEILGASRDPDGCGWGKELRMHDAEGREHRIHIADAALHRHAAQVCQSLANVGLQVNGDSRPQLAEYLAGARVKGRITRVTRTGWHHHFFPRRSFNAALSSMASASSWVRVPSLSPSQNNDLWGKISEIDWRVPASVSAR